MGLLSLVPGGAILYAAIAAIVLLAGGIAGYEMRGLFDAPKIANAEAAAAQAGKALANEQAAAARAVATANATAAEQQTMLSARIAELQASLAATTIERDRISSTLTEELNHATAKDSVPLGAPVRHYLDGVRAQQSGAGHPAPS